MVYAVQAAAVVGAATFVVWGAAWLAGVEAATVMAVVLTASAGALFGESDR